MENSPHPAPWDATQDLAAVPGDEPLLDAVRQGDARAYGELYRRHHSSVLAVARMHTNSPAEAEDVTSEAFTRVLALLKSGGGPQQFLRAYLVTAVSRLAADRANDLSRTQPHAPWERGALDRIEFFDDTVVRQVDAAVVARAFASLPERWQEVLWYLEIEGRRPRQVAEAVGMQPNAVSALGKRARDGLRTAYMQQHVSSAALATCHDYSSQLGAFVRGTLTPSKIKLVQDHLDSCPRCTAEYLQLQDLGVGLRGWMLPVLAGLPLWTDASDRLAAALGTVGALGSTSVAAVASAATGPQAAASGGTAGTATTATTATAAGVSGTAGTAGMAAGAVAAPVAGTAAAVSGSSSFALGAVLGDTAGKVVLAAAGLAVAGAGTAAVVSVAQDDSPRDIQQAQTAGPSVGSDHAGAAAAASGPTGDPADPGTPTSDPRDSAGGAAGDGDTSRDTGASAAANTPPVPAGLGVTPVLEEPEAEEPTPAEPSDDDAAPAPAVPAPPDDAPVAPATPDAPSAPEDAGTPGPVEPNEPAEPTAQATAEPEPMESAGPTDPAQPTEEPQTDEGEPVPTEPQPAPNAPEDPVVPEEPEAAEPTEPVAPQEPEPAEPEKPEPAETEPAEPTQPPTPAEPTEAPAPEPDEPAPVAPAPSEPPASPTPPQEPVEPPAPTPEPLPVDPDDAQDPGNAQDPDDARGSDAMPDPAGPRPPGWSVWEWFWYVWTGRRP